MSLLFQMQDTCTTRCMVIGVPSLSSMPLVGNEITELLPGAFAGLKQLRALEVQGNRLATDFVFTARLSAPAPRLPLPLLCATPNLYARIHVLRVHVLVCYAQVLYSLYNCRSTAISSGFTLQYELGHERAIA